jgi:hypothetical protein
VSFEERRLCFTDSAGDHKIPYHWLFIEEVNGGGSLPAEASNNMLDSLVPERLE